MVEIVGTGPTPVDGQAKGEQVARDALAGYVMGKWERAYWDRNNIGFSGHSINSRLLRCLRAARRKYNPDDTNDDCADVYLGVSSMVMRTLKAWIKDIVAAAGGKWGTLEPTPIPDLPEDMKEAIVQRLKNELMALQRQQVMQSQMASAQPGMPGMPPMAAPAPGMLDGAQGQAFVSMAKQLKDSALKRAFDMAKRSAERAERKILDMFTEGGLGAAMSAILDDIATFPFCILAGPFDKKVRKLVWKGNKAIDDWVVAQCVERVSPFDFYWSVDSTDTQNGEWVARRNRMTQKNLFACIGMEGIDDDAVREIIQEYGDRGWALTEYTDKERERLEDRGTISNTQNGLIDVLQYCGLVPGSFLMDQAEMAVEDVDQAYEVMVWVTAGRTLRCMFNPYPRGRRPFHKACFSDIPGSFAGEALAEILADIQRVANASARSLVKNMAFAAGPIGEVNDDRLADGEKVEDMEPYRLIHTKSDAYGGNEAPALKFARVPSTAAELIAVEAHYTQLAHAHSGIPAYASGQAPTGGAGRTLGGLSLLMSNAAKGVKATLENIDEGIVQPVFEMEYDLLLLYDPDASLKADAQIVARGASGLLQRELNQGRAVELLQILQPFAGQMDPANPPVPPKAIQELLRQVAEPLGLKLLENPEDSVGFELQQLGAMSPQAATAGPALDGRSTSQMTPQ